MFDSAPKRRLGADEIPLLVSNIHPIPKAKVSSANAKANNTPEKCNSRLDNVGERYGPAFSVYTLSSIHKYV